MTLSPIEFSKNMYHAKPIPRLIKTYSKLFQWPKLPNLKMIDVGTGPGHVLMKVESLIPSDYAKIVCVDKDEDMINFFNSVPKNPKISCRLLDIESEQLPEDLKGRFDFAFSSYCLTYVSNFRQAFQNTSKLLRPNGELFYFWFKSCHMNDIYRNLNQSKKWAPYTNDFKNWETYFDVDDPVGKLKTEFDQTDLKILKAELLEDTVFEEHDEQPLLDLFSSLDLVSKRIPKCDLPKYKEDFHNLVRLNFSIDDSPEAEYKVKFPCPTIVVAAKKI